MWFHIQSLTSFLSWWQILNQVSPEGHLAPAPSGHLLAVTLWLCFCLSWVPVYIYNFTTPMHPSWIMWSASVCQPTQVVFLFTQLEHPVPEIPDWQFCQRSICNTTKRFSESLTALDIDRISFFLIISRMSEVESYAHHLWRWHLDLVKKKKIRCILRNPASYSLIYC